MPHLQSRAFSRPLILGAIIALASTASAQQTATPPKRGVEKSVIVKQESRDWLDVTLKARSMLFDPATGVGTMVMDPDLPMGISSPDGKRIAYIASDPARVKGGHDFDLFVADVDPNQPSGRINARRLTTDQDRPMNTTWLPDGSGVAFQAGGERASEVWFIALAPGSEPVRLSDQGKRSLHLSVTPVGEVAWVQINRTEIKQQFDDLILQRPPTGAQQENARRIMLHDQFISAYAFSPDGSTLAWSDPGSLHLVNLKSSESREIPCHGIHRQLINHMAYGIVWRPDGKVFAATFGFAGGIARELNGDPNEPWPRMFAEDKVFFIPADWSPDGESLKVGEGDDYPSPMATDPKAEMSPPAGDQSKPWWVREIPMRPFALKWISAAEAKERIEKTAAPPDDKIEQPSRRMPPPPRTPPD